MRLGPGKTGTLELKINLVQIARQSPDAGPWRLSSVVEAYTTSPRRKPAPWRLTGEIVSPVTPLPTAFDKPLLLSRFDEPKSVTQHLRVTPSVRLMDVTSDQPAIRVAATPLSGSGLELGISVDPAQLPPGTFRGRATLRFVDRRGQALPPLPVEVVGQVEPTVAAHPSVLLFLTPQQRELVRLESTCGRPFAVVGIDGGEGIRARELNASVGNVYARQLEVESVTPDPSLLLTPLHVDIQTDGASSPERITIMVQRPTPFLAELRPTVP
jgi:hypothetical protein